MNILSTLDPQKIFSEDNNPNLIKQIIQQYFEDQRKNFNPQDDIESLLFEKAIFIDNILTFCWNHFLKQHASQLSLIATGGYGRKELFPHSDLDILILINNPETIEFQDSLSVFSNSLWDIGLKPGQSVRTISECIQKSKEDQTIMTNLLEIRLICGNQDLFNNLKNDLSQEKIWPSEQYFDAKMQEQQLRYSKYHDTAYNLEPNVKEGPGGLRDLQNIAWVFQHHYKAETLKELIKYGFFSKSEYNELIACRNILWHVRYALHIFTNRCEDRLIFDYQRELATQFGFIDKNNHPDVENFMQHYFTTVMELERMNEMLLQAFSEKLIGDTPQELQLNPNNPYFTSINGYLEAKEIDLFNNHPLALLEIFPLLQQNPSLKGVRASTIRLVRKNIHLIDDEFRNNLTANKLFLSILKSPNGITDQFRRMNRYGILAAYIPAFANIVARMQYDLFHIYTVDAHTLFVLRNLRRLSLEKHDNELPFCNNVFLNINKPQILYLAALFHDIAKGMGGDHSVLGADIVQSFCTQHKLSKSDAKLVTWLVRNHLVMSMTAQRKDISDPDVIHDFALQVGSIDYLNHLYLFTVADIRATNPSLWNSWKDTLLLELYTFTYSALHLGLQNPIEKSERIADNKQEAKEELIGLGVSEATFKKTWGQLYDDNYFLRYSSEEIAWHTIAIASTKPDELPLVILRPQNQRGSVEIFVFAKNDKSIFTFSVATLDQLGLTILDARIASITSTSKKQYVLNSFQVLEQSGGAIKELDREIHICKTLRSNLCNHAVNGQFNIHRQSRQAKHFPIASKIICHKDPFDQYTIIELVTTDHPGLLASVGQLFIDLNVQLHDAKITTIGSRVEDMFYITDSNDRPITDEKKLKNIKSKLISIIEEKES
ncbi:MAG: [protein-PII] uridylyltransferase [Methylococcales bacterium]|nr:[protein-PII] uridylyltransferase [Methylococcales bacterium]